MESLTYFAGPEPPMHYTGAYRFLFASPNRWMNLLLLAVCVLIPFVGPLVLIGYLIEILVPRLNEDWPGWAGTGPYPDFQFDRFVPYLTRGLWPFLVSLVAGVVLIIPIYIVAGLGIVLLASLHAGGAVVAVLGGLFALVLFAVILVATLVSVPLSIRASLLQDFGPSFSLAWTRDFLARAWRELLLSLLFLWVTAIPLVILGYAACFVGLYPAMALLIVAQWHLHFQVYRVYVARGGAPVPVKGAPPPLPPAGAATTA